MKLLRLSAIFLAVTLSFAWVGPSSVEAEEEIRVILDYEMQSYDQSAILVDGTTLVPMRGIFESLGAVVTWDGVNQKITATKRNTTVELQIGVQTAKVNGATRTLAKKPQIVNGRTLVPLRFVSEALGAKVAWEGETRTVEIFSVEDQLFESVLDNDLEAVKISLGQGLVDPNGRGLANPLFYATIHGARDPIGNEIADVLLKEGADPDFQDDLGMTAMMMAAEMGNREAVELLLKANANVHLQSTHGGTALWHAAVSEEGEIVALLRAAGDSETAVPLLADAKTEDEIIDVLQYYIRRVVFDNTNLLYADFKDTDRAMILHLENEARYTAFQQLSDSAKKKLIVEYVQDHWGDIPGAEHCFAVVYYEQALLGIDVTDQTQFEEAKIVYPEKGGYVIRF